MHEAVIEYIESKNWKYQVVHENRFIHFGISANNGKIDCVADVREERRQFIFLSHSIVNAFGDKLHQVAEYLNRINYSLVIGSFELNMDDGKIRFKTSMFYDENLPPSLEVIERTIITNLYMMDRYIPGIMSILFGHQTPKEAFDEIESD
jgi:hypothetical protein